MVTEWRNQRIAEEAKRAATPEQKLLQEYSELLSSAEGMGLETRTEYAIDPPFGAWMQSAKKRAP